MNNFVTDARVIELSKSIIQTTIKIRKQYKVKLTNAIIAATALVYDLKVTSRNVNDFSIEDLEIVNSHSF